LKINRHGLCPAEALSSRCIGTGVAQDISHRIDNNLIGDLAMNFMNVIMVIFVVLSGGAAVVLLRNLWP
jgi:hypothetical protein